MSKVLNELQKASEELNSVYQIPFQYEISGEDREKLIETNARISENIMQAQKHERDRMNRNYKKRHPIKWFYYHKIWPKYTSYWHTGGWYWCFHLVDFKNTVYENIICKCGRSIENPRRSKNWQSRVQLMILKAKRLI